MEEDVILRYKNGRIIPIKSKEYKIPKEIITREYNKRKNDFNEKFADVYIAKINPNDFIELTTNANTLVDIKDETLRYGELDINKINESFMFMEIDLKTGKILNHEGRHRMMLLKNNGYKDVEILIYPGYGSSDRYNPITYHNLNVFNQLDENFNTNIKEIIPLNKEGYEKIMKGRK